MEAFTSAQDTKRRRELFLEMNLIGVSNPLRPRHQTTASFHLDVFTIDRTALSSAVSVVIALALEEFLNHDLMNFKHEKT